MPDQAHLRLRAAIYARVSTEEQREGQTIDSQIAELERFASDKSWTITGIYKDEGWSGSLLDRPELDRLRDDAAHGRFDTLLINDVDRLARDVSHLGIVKRDLERHGIQVIFRKLPAEKSPTYNLMVNILGSFAEFEREMIADRTRRGRRHKVEVRGQYLGSQPPYGYRYIPKDHSTGKDGYLEIVTEEAMVVRQMYEWVGDEGLSSYKVLERLNDDETMPRPRKAGKWAKSTVRRILRSEVYAGVWHYNKLYSSEPIKPISKNRYKHSIKSSSRLRARAEWLPVILPANLRIVERELWQRVQQQLTANIAFSPRNTKHLYLLKGLVRCGGCGAMYVGDPCHGQFYYRCAQRCKKMPSIKDIHLDGTVWRAIEEAVLDPSIITAQVAELHERNRTNAGKMKNEASDIKEALEQVQTEESRILEAYRKAIISPVQLGEELQKIGARKTALENRRMRLVESAQASDLPKIERSIADYCRVAAERLKSFTDNERQRFLRLIINGIVFEGERVRVRGILPLSGRNEGLRLEDKAQTSEDAPELLNGFASMAAYYEDRNSAEGRAVEFELIKSIIRIPSLIQKRNVRGQFVKSIHEISKAA